MTSLAFWELRGKVIKACVFYASHTHPNLFSDDGENRKGAFVSSLLPHKGSHFTGPVMREIHHNPSGKPSDLTINHPQPKITDLFCSLSLTKRLSQHYLLINTYILHSYINRAKKWIIWEQSQNDHCPEGLPSAEQRSFDSGY